MLIRISLCLLFIYACSSGEFKGHQIDKSGDQITAPPVPPPVTPPPECLNTCEEACEDWGEWSDLTPATDTVCEPPKGGKLSQSQTRTRTCQATCPEVTCPKTETNQKDVDGTKDCPDPPPPCKTSCTTGCKAWPNWSAWSPTAASMCKDDMFTQTRTRARECFPTCDDKAECLCPGVQCETTKSESQSETGTKEIDCRTACDTYTWSMWSPQATAAEVCTGQTVSQTRTGTRNCPRDDCSTCKKTTTESRPLKGTKVTDCQKDCTAWQAVTGVKGVWSPARDAVPLGETFQQQRTEKRTCSEVCPGSTCEITRVETQDAVGTKEPPPPPPVVDTAPPPPPTCNSSCSDGCEAWQDWGKWTVESSCPTTIAFGAELLAAGEEERSRTRTCNNNLCADAECFTSNTETRTTPCACPEGRVLAADGTCVCDSARRQYKVGNACQQCPSDYNFKQVNGVWTCEQTCACCADWEETSVSQQASEVCKNLQFTPEYTYERTCDDCPAGNTCPLTKKEFSAQPVQGTKTTNCEDHCTDWSEWTWTATKACPSTDTSFTKSSATFTGTKTRTCTGLCSASDCEVTDNSGRDTRACDYCQGTGQKKLDQGKPTESCVCDDANNYYRTGNTCTLCEEPSKKLENGKCVCDEDNNYYEKDNTCILCEPPKEFKDDECVEGASPSSVSSSDVNVNASEVDNTPPPEEPPEEPAVKTCADFCDPWEKAWTDWKLTTKECPADNTSFTKPELEAEKATRTRTRECKKLPAGLKCFTANTETRTTACEWCQGFGQKFDEGKCVCDADGNYYRDAHYGGCTSCGDKVVNDTGDGCVCAESSCTANYKKTWNSDTCSCGECQQQYVDYCNGNIGANCECISGVQVPVAVLEAEAETKISIKIYHGCFTDTTSQLYLPSSSGSLKSNTNNKWKLEGCFDNEGTAYESAVDTITSGSYAVEDVQAVFQKLYDCADREGKTDFITALTTSQQCSGGSGGGGSSSIEIKQ